MVDKQVQGLIEIWQDPNRGPDAQRGFLQFLVRMAGLAAGYARNHQLRQMVGQQQVWTQLETFARQIHNSLNPTEVAYLVANEARRLIECDRISVGVRRGGKKCKVEAISGADVVEKRSNLVQLMRKLFDAVLAWGEKLVFTGAKDDSLPPAVLKALDGYLAESTSKLLVIMPLKDEREIDAKKPARSALMMESFDPPTTTDQLTARLEVIGKHATSALYNATEHKRIPFRFIWMPIAKLQDGLGGKAKAITLAVMLGVMVLVVALIAVPYPLKMEAKGQVWPIERPFIFGPMNSQVRGFQQNLKSGQQVGKGEELVRLYAPEIQEMLSTLVPEIDALKQQIDAVGGQIQNDPAAATKQQLQLKRIELAGTLKGKQQLLKKMRELYNVDPLNPGEVWVLSPINGVVLTPDFRQKLTGATIKESTPLLRLGEYNPVPKLNKLGQWEIELKIPQKHIGQVLSAFDRARANKQEEVLDVDILLASEPTSKYKGKLSRDKVAAEATPDKNENNESEPVTLAWVRLSGADIPTDYQMPVEHLVAGLEVRTRIRCGNRAMGYSLLYGVWEFIFEKVVFFF